MKFLKVPKSVVDAKLADEGRDYELTYDDEGVPILPSIAANPYITYWRKPFAEYMTYFWSELQMFTYISRLIDEYRQSKQPVVRKHLISRSARIPKPTSTLSIFRPTVEIGS